MAREVLAEKGRLEGEDLDMIAAAIEAILRSERLIDGLGKKGN
jgi:hypothetical protein